ncbi:putative DNA repair protein Rad4 [Aspergillus steynii IBT 23096]|uniref:Putative DNA repair protein Rad4 n=1 Tax=Aspergillus steynii IBT 23096 TaxID=1392250 RepID=A0A2I2GRZ3_9EURO|nr:putative DNA repair protein Rad4 [Aspergillus steynii IBT 23096]PLB55633.1 putative DNA repair protein Rad4 [Aspergillus steynii IBT 23096]
MRRSNRTRPAKGGPSRSRQSRQHDGPDDDEIPQVYREMLAEAEARDAQAPAEDRPIKRRKVQEQPVTAHVSQVSNQSSQSQTNPDQQSDRQVQMVYDSSTSEESDMEWEEVDLQQPPAGPAGITPTAEDSGPMEITLDKHEDQKRRVAPRRKPITATERKLRLDIHKVHVLCLMRHVQMRNLWCNDEEVQKFLKRILSRNTITLLNPPQDKPQYAKSTTFIDGLNQASDAFLKRFKVTQPGLKRAHWAEDPDSLKKRVEQIMVDPEVIFSKEDFQKQAKTLQGSRDFGAQLFCALLRSAAVEARLVCSLQPLPFSGTTKNMTPTKPKPQYIVISSDNPETSADEQIKSQGSPTPQSRTRRLGRPQFKPSRPSKPIVTSPRPIPNRESSYPVFWVEAFNEAVQKWIPVDPLVTKSLAKSFKFEPPSSDPYNCMSYVVAFEEDASARDVTRRYAKAFNAKTRKLRVECSKNGERWWQRVLEFYEKPFLEDRDEIEISELTAKTAAEPMPRNVLDFKDHPIYALERHLRRNEVVFPKRAIGQVSLGKSGSKHEKMEPVYRRSDVHSLRSADKWYRLGRDVKLGQQPMKRVPAHRVALIDDEDSETAAETPLYSLSQTEIYKPPPVVQGKIPKNVYGNLDVYVPTMVPSGGVHIIHSEAARAAKILGIDYADAVTGFDFKGRHGTAVFRGVVIATEHREALEEVIQGLENEKMQAQLEEKSAECLRFWRHFLLKLRISERVKGYAVEGDESDNQASGDMSDDDFGDAEDYGGGFIPEPDQEIASPSAGMNIREYTAPDIAMNHSAASPSSADDTLGGGFMPEEDNNAAVSPSQPETNPNHTDRNAADHSRYTLVVLPNDKNEKPSNVEAADTDSGSSRLPVFDLDIDTGPSGNFQGKQGSLETPITVESSTAADSKSASVEALSGAPSQSQSRIPSLEAPESEAGSNDEGSLLSEDPEDEDAIPEWLMSD